MRQVSLPERLERRSAARLAGTVCGRDQDLFLIRLRRHLPAILRALAAPYGGAPPATDGLVERLVDLAADAYAERPEPLRLLDLERELRPDWLLSADRIGYVTYARHFADRLAEVTEHLDYLAELGVTYVHLMDLFETRPGDADGGYAVVDHGRIAPDLGTVDDLTTVASAMRARGMSLCVDLVLNHVAREHRWAEAARRGDPRYRRYFHLVDDRDEVAAWERHLPEIFPHRAPGNFTFDPDLGGWVWTTFHEFQWDLDWSNPEVLLEWVHLLLDLANRGVDVFRLDAVAFLWKRMGTDCQNQPEVHDLVRILRTVTRIAAPAVAFKAEAIVPADRVVAYLGTGPHRGELSTLAYHHTLMAHLWSALASRDARLLRRAMSAMPELPEGTAWATYLRCHDDIGWAIGDDEAADVGLSGDAHRRFLVDYYVGAFPGSHARGAVFGENPRTGDRRTCGTAASLAGLELALERDDVTLRQMSLERLLLAHAVVYAFAGVPLVYMGDELGLTNDHGYVGDPAHREDARWIHRPRMPWGRAERRHRAGTIEARLFEGLQRLGAVRRRLPQLHCSTPLEIIDPDDPRVFAFARRHPLGDLLCVFNVSESPASARLPEDLRWDRLSDAEIEVRDGRVELPPYARLWLTARR